MTSNENINTEAQPNAPVMSYAPEPDFSGTYTPKLDEKGRFIIPAKFREVFDTDGVCTLTHGLDGCLWLYSKPSWQEVFANLSKLSDIREGERKLKRFFIGGAKECELDKQGRILIPPDLRDFAKINGEICLVGIGNKIEIWSAAEFARYDEKTDVSPEVIAENIEFLTL